MDAVKKILMFRLDIPDALRHRGFNVRVRKIGSEQLHTLIKQSKVEIVVKELTAIFGEIPHITTNYINTKEATWYDILEELAIAYKSSYGQYHFYNKAAYQINIAILSKHYENL